MESLKLQVIELLERIWIAACKGNFPEVDRLMLEARDLIEASNPKPLPRRRPQGWG